MTLKELLRNCGIEVKDEYKNTSYMNYKVVVETAGDIEDAINIKFDSEYNELVIKGEDA